MSEGDAAHLEAYRKRVQALEELLDVEMAEVTRLREALDEVVPRATNAVRLLSLLVELKDGPRDSTYEQEKPKAWSAVRNFLVALAEGSDVHLLGREPPGQRVAVCGAVEESRHGERLNFTVDDADISCRAWAEGSDVREPIAPCPWCRCIGYHAEVCGGFAANDPGGSDVLPTAVCPVCGGDGVKPSKPLALSRGGICVTCNGTGCVLPTQRDH